MRGPGLREGPGWDQSQGSPSTDRGVPNILMGRSEESAIVRVRRDRMLLAILLAAAFGATDAQVLPQPTSPMPVPKACAVLQGEGESRAPQARELSGQRPPDPGGSCGSPERPLARLKFPRHSISKGTDALRWTGAAPSRSPANGL